MLKMPKAPKLPKKPSQTASLSSKQSYVRKVKDMRQKYYALCVAVTKENASRKKINDESVKLSKVIAGIGSITTLPASFKTISVRKKRTTAVSGVKKKKPKKKAAPKKKKAVRRRRY